MRKIFRWLVTRIFNDLIIPNLMVIAIVAIMLVVLEYIPGYFDALFIPIAVVIIYFAYKIIR